ncbi:hypothetical protein ACFQHN_16610 [Natrialbaceae archaeon GCM10025896]
MTDRGDTHLGPILALIARVQVINWRCPDGRATVAVVGRVTRLTALGLPFVLTSVVRLVAGGTGVPAAWWDERAPKRRQIGENEGKPRRRTSRFTWVSGHCRTVMHGKTKLMIAVAIALLVGATGTAAAQPADGPPADLPDPVPEFVSDILGAITDFVGGTIGALGEVVRDLTPGGDAGVSSGSR